MTKLRLVTAVVALTICGGVNARPIQLIFDIFPETYYDYSGGMGSFPAGTSSQFTIVFEDFWLPKLPGQEFLLNTSEFSSPLPDAVVNVSEFDTSPTPANERGAVLRAFATPHSDRPITVGINVEQTTVGGGFYDKRAQTYLWAGSNFLPRSTEAGKLDLYIKQNIGEGSRWEFSSTVSDYVLGSGGYSSVPNSQFFGYAILDSVSVLAPTPVPEPSTWAYMAVGLLCSAFAVRRRL
jgi:hypothetical protein